MMRRRKPSIRAKFQYAFDNSMAHGPIALIGWLAAISTAAILVIAFIVWLFGLAPEDTNPITGQEHHGFISVVWVTLMRTLDAGTMGGDAGHWPFLMSMLVTTVAGIFVISTLIGVLSSGIEQKLEELQRGRSLVLEYGHTLILGWSPHIFTIVSELVIANENQHKPSVVILADRDTPEMTDEIRRRVPDLKNTRLVCRSGDPLDLSDLEIANPHEAKSIIILEPDGGHNAAHVVKAILALTNNPNRRKDPYHIVAEVGDAADLPAARMVGGSETTIVATGDLISRLIVQTARQSGLSVVFTELLDFGGDEIYLASEPALDGQSFGDALLAYETSSVIGISSPSGTHLNPPMHTVLKPGDQIIAITADDDTLIVAPKSASGAYLPATLVQPKAIIDAAQSTLQPERTLILGWNHRATSLLNALDEYVADGSPVTIVGSFDDHERDQLASIPLTSLRPEFVVGNPTDRRLLERLNPLTFDQIIVLPDSDKKSEQEADAQTLVTLLHLRDIQSITGTNVRLVTEMLDVRNRELAEITGADDFIVSSKLTGLLLTQLSENVELAPVFDDLLDADGSEIYLKPAADFVRLGESVTVATIVEAARRRGAVAIGYRLNEHAHNAAKQYGVVVNPPKSSEVTFGPEDKIVVIAED